MSTVAPHSGSPTPYLSVVVPAFNEEARLGPTLERIVAYLDGRPEPSELLVADDGSTDATRAVAERFGERGVRLVGFERNRGKGAAVRLGVGESRGEWVLICDADLSTPIEEVERLEARSSEAELILGSRSVPESRVTQRQPLARELMGKVFNRIVRSLGLADLNDTQCGFKLIRGEVARQLFARMRIERFAFDVELVWMARSLGHRVTEVGVVWHNSPRSTVDPVRDSSSMLLDLIRLRLRGRPKP